MCFFGKEIILLLFIWFEIFCFFVQIIPCKGWDLIIHFFVFIIFYIRRGEHMELCKKYVLLININGMLFFTMFLARTYLLCGIYNLFFLYISLEEYVFSLCGKKLQWKKTNITKQLILTFQYYTLCSLCGKYISQLEIDKSCLFITILLFYNLQILSNFQYFILLLKNITTIIFLPINFTIVICNFIFIKNYLTYIYNVLTILQIIMDLFLLKNIKYRIYETDQIFVLVILPAPNKYSIQIGKKLQKN